MPQNGAGNSRRGRPPSGKRVGNAEIERRLALVEELLASGTPRSQIITAFRESDGMSERSVDGYIARVRERWATDAASRAPHRRDEFVARMERLIQELRANKAWTALVSAERLLADVQGLRSSTIEVQATVEAPPSERDAGRSVEDALCEASAVGRALLHAITGGDNETGIQSASAEAVREAADTFAGLAATLRSASLPPPVEGIQVH